QDTAQRERLLDQLRDDVRQQRDEERAKAAAPRAPRPGAAPVRRSPAVREAPVPVPPFWGHRTAEIPWRSLDQLLPFVDRNTLLPSAARTPLSPHHCKYTTHARTEWQRLVEAELEPRLQALWADARVRRWLTPRAIYGYFPVQADGNDLVVYDPAAHEAGRPPR